MDDMTRPERPKLELDETGSMPSGGATPDKKSEEDEEPAFQTPEEIAAKESNDMSAKPLKVLRDKISLKKPWLSIRPHGKKQWLIFSAACLAGLVILVGSWWFFLRPDTSLVDNSKPLEKVEFVPPDTRVPSKLSGLKVDPSVNERPVTAVMIENSPDARPQSGLRQASIVFEAIAEGGITRFCALYQDTEPKHLGPIRSVRPYYIDWFLPFDAAIAHVGGSPKGLIDIKKLGAKDLDQFANSGAYHRTTHRYAPHNMYSSIDQLRKVEKAKGYKTSNFTGFDRKEEAPAKKPKAKTINLDISGFLYNVQYKYNAKTNSYNRSEGGKPHKDERTGKQLSPKVVVAIVMSRGIDGDGQHTDYKTTGSGRLYVFQDGKAFSGSWSKRSRTAQWVFTDKKGEPLAFNPGQTWLTMVDSPGSVSY